MFAGIILFTLQDKDALLVALAYKTISFKLCAHIVIFLVCKPAFFSSLLVREGNFMIHFPSQCPLPFKIQLQKATSPPLRMDYLIEDT